MDTLEKSQKIIEGILTEYIKIPYANRQLEIKLIIDRTATNYIVMTLGWEGEQRVHGCILHIEIIDGKIWIQRDGTEYGIANELVAEGYSTILKTVISYELSIFTTYCSLFTVYC